MNVAIFFWRHPQSSLETIARKIVRHARSRNTTLYVSLNGPMICLRDEIDTAKIDTLEFAVNHRSSANGVLVLLSEVEQIARCFSERAKLGRAA